MDIDSINSVRIRLYSITGIKLAELNFKSDTFLISYIIDESFREQIYKTYIKANESACLYKIIIDFVNADLFNNLNNHTCYNVSCIDDTFIIYSVDYYELFSISRLKANYFKGIDQSNNYLIKFHNTDYSLIFER